MNATRDLAERYARDGFAVLPDFVTREACDELIARAREMVADFDPRGVRSIFTTHEQTRASDEYFLSSGDKVRFFFEEDAFDDRGELRQPKELSINKIGHAMHDLDPVFDRFSRHPDLAGVARAIGLDDPVLLQSMYIFKQPYIGGEVGCHQDAAFLYTDPITVTGFWFALQDATLENGCLWAEPGGHRGPLRSLFKRHGGDDAGTYFETLSTEPLPDPHGGTLVPIEAPAGTLVVLNGLLPHWSDTNRSPQSRHAYSVHCIAAGADYPSFNWLQRRNLPLRGFTAGALA